MENYEFVKKLNEYLETKSLEEIKNFVVILRKVYFRYLDEVIDEESEKDIDDEYDVENADDIDYEDEIDNDLYIKYENIPKDYEKSLKYIKNIFDKKEIVYNNETYNNLLPCYFELIEDEDFFDLLAEKLENVKYTHDNGEKIVESINAFLDLYNDDDYEEYEEEMDFGEIGYELKNVIREKISELSINDFLKLKQENLDNYYKDIVVEKIKNMNEVETYKYLSYLNYEVLEEREYEILNKLKQLDSPALYNLYDLINYNNVETRDKIKSLYYLKSEAIEEIKPNVLLNNNATDSIREVKVLYEPKCDEDDYNRISKLPKYKLFLKKLSKLNSNELVLYLTGKYINIDDIKIKEEKELIESKIKQLSDEDLKVLYCILNNKKNQKIMDEIEERKIDIEKNVVYVEETPDLKFLKVKDEKLSNRIEIYERINDFSIDLLEIDRPEFATESARKKADKIDDAYIESICTFERCNDAKCIKIINNLNRNEKKEDYGCLDIGYDELFDMSDSEKIDSYKQMIKSQIIRYMEKRIFSMPKGYLSMIDVSNENGVFNDIVKMGLENEGIKLKKNSCEEYEYE